MSLTKRIANVVLKEGPITSAEVAKILHARKSTVRGRLSELNKRGIVVADSTAANLLDPTQPFEYRGYCDEDCGYCALDDLN